MVPEQTHFSSFLLIFCNRATCATMGDLSVYTTTFNCARELASSSHLSSALFNDSKTSLPPDLIVLCLQEIAPIGYSFLGGSYLVPYFSRLSKIVQDAVGKQFESGVEYGTLLVRNVGMTGLMIFARPEIKDRLHWIATAGVGLGVWDMGNKGAVGARLGIENGKGEVVPITFVSAHLAPGESECKRRNVDWRNICEGLIFTRENIVEGKKGGAEAEPLLAEGSTDSGTEKQEQSLFDPYSHVIFAGDLNYRTADQSPQPDDHQTWSAGLDALFAHDQLNRERKAKHTLQLLSEHPVNFPPTYKYSTAALQAAKADEGLRANESSGKDVQLWAKHRVPSWCDRILFLASSPPTVHSYNALSLQPTSDHRPVALSADFQLQSIASEAVKPPIQPRRDWRERRAVARRYEILVGIASYLALTWEGEALLVGTVIGIIGAYIVLRTLV
jgi:hypothetical protein